MNINIFGSTGIIGTKSLELIDEHFPQLKINLLCANSNIKLLKKQISKSVEIFSGEILDLSQCTRKCLKFLRQINFNQSQNCQLS